MRFGLILLLSALACGGGSKAPTVTAAEFPAAFGKAVCQVKSSCHQEAAYVEAQCEEESSAVYGTDLAKAIAAGKATFDAAQAQACIDGLKARGCGRTPPAVDQACEQAVRGTVAAGGSCNWLYECATGRCEPESAGACPATCKPVAGNGASCPDPACDFRAGLRCIDNVCSALHTAGQKCKSVDDCGVDFYCDATDQCAARGGELASCEENGQCAAGLFCDVSSEGGLCKKQIAPGQACTATSLGAIRNACVDGSVCKGFAFTKTASTKGTCTALGDVGAACAATADVTGCAEGLVCTNGKCAEKPVSGSCAQDDDCKEGVAYCDGAACQLLKDAGAACADAKECESHFCDPGTAQCVDTSSACHEP